MGSSRLALAYRRSRPTYSEQKLSFAVRVLGWRAALLVAAMTATGCSAHATLPEDGAAWPAGFPSKDSVEAAMKAAKPDVEACVRDVAPGLGSGPRGSTARILFGSDGVPISVMLGGWADSNGRSDCIRAALLRVKLPPFTQPKFGVAIRF